MCCLKPLDRSQEGLECIVGSTFLLLLFSFWENSRRGRLKILSRKKKMLIRPKKEKLNSQGRPLILRRHDMVRNWNIPNAVVTAMDGSISSSTRGLEATSKVFQDCVVSCTLLCYPTFQLSRVLNSSAFHLAPSHLTPYLPLCSPGQPQGLMGAQYNQWFTLSH